MTKLEATPSQDSDYASKRGRRGQKKNVGPGARAPELYRTSEDNARVNT